MRGHRRPHSAALHSPVAAAVFLATAWLLLAQLPLGHAQQVSLGADGYFRRGPGQLFVPLGVNYWPASAGAYMWQRFNASEVEADLALLASDSHGGAFNSVRLFLIWGDFEQAPGVYNSTRWGGGKGEEAERGSVGGKGGKDGGGEGFVSKRHLGSLQTGR